MIDIPSWVYVAIIAGAAVAAAYPSIKAALDRPSVPASKPQAAQAYSRAAWINQLCDLTNEAERAGQGDVATASRALIAALVAVREGSK